MTMRPSGPAAPRRPPSRPGFTFVEVLIAIAIAGILAMIVAPNTRAFRDRASVRAARQEIVATIDAARAAALQRGRTARFVVRGDSALAVVDTGPPGLAATGSRVVLAPESVRRQYGVSLRVRTDGDTLLAYDSRGLANPRLGRTARYIIVGRWATDSVCVTSLGTILPRRCEL